MSVQGRRAAGLVFVLLCSVYLITFRGLISSIDELALFSLTESLAQRGSLQTPQLAFAQYHNPVGRLEPFQSLLAAPLYWLAVRVSWLGNVQAVLLSSVLIAAATGSVLCWLLLARGHSPTWAAITALFYGLATIAWPYSRTLLREPLAGLLLLLAAYGLIRWQQTRRWRHALLALACLALALLTKIMTAMAWPAFALAFLLEEDLARRARIRRLIVLAAIALVGGLAFSWISLTRQRADVLTLLNEFFVSQEWSTFGARLFGLTLGAGRGVFVFSPVLLLALPGLVLSWRGRRTEFWLALGTLASFAIGYARYAQWHSGLAWGSRFLLPVIPLLILPVAEWLAWAGRSAQRRIWLALTGVVATASFVLQCAASTAASSVAAGLSPWDNLIDYARSPAWRIFGFWKLAHLDMLWLHGPAPVHLDHVYVNGWLVALPLVSLIGAAGVLAAVLRARRQFAPSLFRWLGAALSVALLAGTLVLLWQAPVVTHGYSGVNPVELRQIAQIVNQDRQEPYTIVAVSNEFHLNVLFNYFKGQFVDHWLSPMQQAGFEGLDEPPYPGTRSLRLIVDRAHMPPEFSGREAELWLDARLYRYRVDWIGEGYEVYSYLYPPAEMPLAQVDYRWQPGMALAAYGMTPCQVEPGEPVWLEFHLTTQQPIKGWYSIFVQLLSPDGVYVSGVDGPPQFGAAMTSWWKPGEEVVDRRAFFVPQGAPAGKYRVIAGFYADGDRLPVFDAKGQELGTHLELGEIEVQAQAVQ